MDGRVKSADITLPTKAGVFTELQKHVHKLEEYVDMKTETDVLQLF